MLVWLGNWLQIKHETCLCKGYPAKLKTTCLRALFLFLTSPVNKLSNFVIFHQVPWSYRVITNTLGGGGNKMCPGAACRTLLNTWPLLTNRSIVVQEERWLDRCFATMTILYLSTPLCKCAVRRHSTYKSHCRWRPVEQEGYWEESVLPCVCATLADSRWLERRNRGKDYDIIGRDDGLQAQV